jgi:hypothetical protein
MKILSRIILVHLSIFFCVLSFGQEKDFSKSALVYKAGLGIFDGGNNSGVGGTIVLGYQRDLLKERLRLNPNLTLGYFNSKFVTDVRDQWFNSISLETNLYFDLIKIQAFSLTLGAGGVINNTKGIYGSGGDGPNSNNNSEYFSDWYYGFYLGGGLRINPKKSKLAFELMPLNFHIGPDYYLEAYASIGLAVKL